VIAFAGIDAGDIRTFAQLVVVGLGTGAAFALVGIGMVLIYRTTNIVNFAQGAFAVLGGLLMVSLQQDMHGAVAAVATVLVVALVGAAAGFVAVGFRGRTTSLASLIITLGLALIASSADLLAFGDRPQTYPPISDRAWSVSGVVVQPQYALVVAVTLLSALLLTLLLRRTIVGYALVACSDSVRAAELVGINVRSVAVIAFAVSAGLSALGTLLLTPVLPVSYESDVAIAVNGFAAAAFGGLASIRLALVGGLVLGIAEQLVVVYWDPQYELAIALVVMLALIGWRSRHEAVE
jgi:branched-chain amino acid transport system permease protein